MCFFFIFLSSSPEILNIFMETQRKERRGSHLSFQVMKSMLVAFGALLPLSPKSLPFSLFILGKAEVWGSASIEEVDWPVAPLPWSPAEILKSHLSCPSSVSTPPESFLGSSWGQRPLSLTPLPPHTPHRRGVDEDCRCEGSERLAAFGPHLSFYLDSHLKGIFQILLFTSLIEQKGKLTAAHGWSCPAVRKREHELEWGGLCSVWLLCDCRMLSVCQQVPLG